MPAFADEAGEDPDHGAFKAVRQPVEPAVKDALVDLREDVLGVFDEARAKDRAHQRADAAHDRHQNNLARGSPLHPLGASQRVHCGQKATGQTGIHPRDHEGRKRIGARVDAGIVQAVLVRFDRPQHHAKGRAEDPQAEIEAEDRDDGAEIIADVEGEIPRAKVERPARVHLEPEEARHRQRGRGRRGVKDAGILEVELQAGLAVGDGRKNRIGKAIGHLGEGERKDREVDPRAA